MYIAEDGQQHKVNIGYPPWSAKRGSKKHVSTGGCVQTEDLDITKGACYRIRCRSRGSECR